MRRFRGRRKQKRGKAVVLPPGWEDPALTRLACGERERLDALSLVLSAVGIDHFLDMERGELLSAEPDREAALAHLALYLRENRDWPPPQPVYPAFRQSAWPVLALMGLLVLFFFHTGPWSADKFWFSRGAADSEAIMAGHQWWRLLTALTLHADLVHLAGNCLIGGFMAYLLARTTGYGLAWLLLLVNGCAGNLLNALLRRDPHLSVGFSTSVFAAVGIFTGLQLVRNGTAAARGILLPLGAGGALLAFLGTEGARTDLGAHFFGFASGLACGILLEKAGVISRVRRPAIQAFFFVCAINLVALSWLFALKSAPGMP